MESQRVRHGLATEREQQTQAALEGPKATLALATLKKESNRGAVRLLETSKALVRLANCRFPGPTPGNADCLCWLISVISESNDDASVYRSFLPRVSEVAQSCLTFCYPMNCNPPGFSVHRIFQARKLEWVAISFSRGSSQPRD